MEPFQDDKGNWWIPARAEGPDGLVGSGWVMLTEDYPQYEQWRAYLAGEADWANKIDRGLRQ